MRLFTQQWMTMYLHFLIDTCMKLSLLLLLFITSQNVPLSTMWQTKIGAYSPWDVELLRLDFQPLRGNFSNWNHPKAHRQGPLVWRHQQFLWIYRHLWRRPSQWQWPVRTSWINHELVKTGVGVIHLTASHLQNLWMAYLRTHSWSKCVHINGKHKSCELFIEYGRKSWYTVKVANIIICMWGRTHYNMFLFQINFCHSWNMFLSFERAGLNLLFVFLFHMSHNDAAVKVRHNNVLFENTEYGQTVISNYISVACN